MSRADFSRHSGSAKPVRSVDEQPATGSHESVEQASPSSQTSFGPLLQPVAGSHVSMPSQTSWSSHEGGSTGVQTPFSHADEPQAFSGSQSSVVPHGMHGWSLPLEQIGPG